MKANPSRKSAKNSGHYPGKSTLKKLHIGWLSTVLQTPDD